MANEAALKLYGQQNTNQRDGQKEDNPQEEEQSNQSTAHQATGDAKRAMNAGKSAFNTAKKTAEVAQKAAQAARAVAILANPWVLGAIAIALAILLIYLLFFNNSGGDDISLDESQATSASAPGTLPGSTPSIPGVTVILKGPDQSQNGADITYEVSVAYDPSLAKVPLENIVLFDTIPNNATFVGTDGIQAADSTPSVVTWSLKDPTNQKVFHITLRPTTDDTFVINTVQAKIAVGAGSGKSTDSDEFLALFTGQGRNLDVLGGRSTFISTVVANSSGLQLTGKESYLGSIYDAGVQYNVNPLIIAGIWGTESGFDPGAIYPFGCLNPKDAGFTENVTCAAGSLNQLMSSYESRSATGSLEIPSTIGNTCIYTDPFIYAYEMYAPICHAEDGNWAARGNLISFYKKFQGL